MMQATVAPPRSEAAATLPGAGWTEALFFAMGAALLLVVEAFANDPGILFGRYLYLDELWVKLLDSDPSLWHSLAALKHSGDFTPPVYHLLIRGSWWLIGGSGETAFRALALAGTWAALCLLYVLLRRSFGVLVALVAVLALWANPLVIRYAFFARPYALLLAATVGFCLVYQRHDSSLRSNIATAAMAALLCTIHYFGIFALVSVVLGDALAHRLTLRGWMMRLLPVAAGPLALLACLPFYRGETEGFTHTSWLAPITARFAVKIAVAEFRFPIHILTLLVLLWMVSEFLSKLGVRFVRANDLASMSTRLRSTAGISGLLLVPLFVVLFSVFDHTNAFVDRYMITALLGFVPLLAILASRSAAPVLIALSVFLVCLSWWNVRRTAEWFSTWNSDRAEIFDNYSVLDDDLPIVTLDIHEAFGLYEYAPSLRKRLFVADLRGHYQNDLIIVDYESATKWRKLYPDMPELITLDDLRRMGEFHLVAKSEFEIVPAGPPPFQRVKGFGPNALFRVHR